MPGQPRETETISAKRALGMAISGRRKNQLENMIDAHQAGRKLSINDQTQRQFPATMDRTQTAWDLPPQPQEERL
jgi:hypothetical protein